MKKNHTSKFDKNTFHILPLATYIIGKGGEFYVYYELWKKT